MSRVWRPPVRLMGTGAYRASLRSLLNHAKGRSGCCSTQADRAVCAAETARRKAERMARSWSLDSRIRAGDAKGGPVSVEGRGRARLSFQEEKAKGSRRRASDEQGVGRPAGAGSAGVALPRALPCRGRAVPKFARPWQPPKP